MSWIPGWESIQATGWWSGFFFWASIVSLIGLGISEVASHRFSERKDELVERQQITEKERHDTDIAQVQHDAALAIERAASLEKEAEVARKETAQAKLELQQLRFPRSFDFERFKELVAKVQAAPVEILFDANAPDASSLATRIWISLVQLKWPMTQSAGPTPVGPPDPNNLMATHGSWVQAAGGGPWGLSVVTTGEPNFDKDPIGSALVSALGQCVSGPPSMTTFGKAYGDLPVGRYRIIIGPKLP